jgi:hypothetical protein
MNIAACHWLPVAGTRLPDPPSIARREKHLMPDSQKQCTLIEELDQRQEEVLTQLDQLNAEIETLLNDCLHARNTETSEAKF